MLVIRKEQMQALSEQKKDCFVNRAMKHLQSGFPAKIKGMDESSQHNMIREVINSANKYQIKTEDNIIRYLEFVIAYGSDFDKLQKAKEILCFEHVDETAKMDLLDINKSELSETVRKNKKMDNAIYENNSESMAPEADSETDETTTTSLNKKQLDCWGIKNVKEVGSIVQGCSSDESEKLSYVVKLKVVKVGEGVISGVKFNLVPSDEKNYYLYSFYVNHPDEVKDFRYQTDGNGEWRENLGDGSYTVKIEQVINVKLQNQTEKNGKYKFEFLEPDTIKENEKSEVLSYNSIKVFHHRDKQDNKKVITTVCLRFIELKCFVDSHMHIMSGHCSTAPMIDKLAYDNSPGNIMRKTEGGLGLSGGLVADLGIGKKPTQYIADKALKDNRRTYERIKTKYYNNCELFTPMVVLTVDFEYAHYNGYDGMTIYRQKKNKNEVIEKRDITKKDVYDNNKFQNYYGDDLTVDEVFCSDFHKKVIKLTGNSINQSLNENKRFDINKDKRFNRGFEPWQKQLEQTIQVAKENPWKLIPFFFYEPRRWLKDTIWLKDKKGTLWDKLPIEEVATEKQSGLFVGFKMYTPYGFKPLDPKLPGIDDFYKYCTDKQIPIMTHCTPGGSYTHERELYLWEDKGVVGDGNAKLEYFNDNFVSPSAWNEVLNNHKNLKLCLAHFGGEKAWAYIISDLCSKYPNVYTDVSDMLHTREYRNIIEDVLLSKAKNAKRILYKVMFGTDWYVMKTSKGPDFQFDYYRYCLRSKRFLDEVTKELKETILDKDEDLWTLFTLVNPFRYLGFVHVVDGNVKVNINLINNIAEGLRCDERVEQASVNKDELKKNTAIIIKTAQWVADYLNSNGERQKLVTWGYEYIDSPIEFPKEYDEKINPKIKIDYSA